ncbi:MAG TPA: glycoside hydrolase domain-containing protein [Planctomycetota bacterium]|nr:glycoside hydrolase domain-containing protein [Planctomycetota bacterium]
MRRYAVVCVLLLLASAAVAGENLIANGGFETPTTTAFKAKLPELERSFYPGLNDSPAAGWVFGGGWDGGRYTVHLSDEAHTGKHAIEIRCGKQGRGGVASSPFKLFPGTILKVSFWIKARDAEGGRIFLNYEGTPGDGWNKLDLDGGTYDWTHVTHRSVVPVRHSRADGQTLMIFVYSKARGSVWIDDVTVETVDVNEMAEAPDTPALVPPRPKDIPEPAGSIGYRIDTASALVKVYPDTDFAPADKLTNTLAVSLARNEYEDAQVIIEAPWRDVTVSDVTFSDLKTAAGAVIPASALSWRRVDFIETAITPPYRVDRVGWYPDPLMPPGAFTVKTLSRTPVWVTVKTAKDTPPGTYTGTITVTPKDMKPTRVPITVTVWDFAVTDETHLRTMTWLGMGAAHSFYGYDWSPEGNRKRGEAVRRYQDILLEHRLGPGGEVVAHVRKGRDGKYDFAGVDATLERLTAGGMNAFIMGTAANLKRAGKNEYTPEFIAQFTEMLKAYGDHLREKGWIDRAYVYTYDEAPRKHWGEVKKIAKAIKQAAPELRILQCLNEPEGVKELAGHVDVFDVYIAQYHKTGVQAMQERGTEAWLAVCCYPMDHPNLFIEYPLIDARIIPMFCWKYNAAGFEYWSPVSWGTNWRRKPPNQWPDAPWDPNTFGRYNGDGYLLYPGPDGVPYPSIRLKALRDGFEDYEYLWTLKQLADKVRLRGQMPPALKRAHELLAMDELITDAGVYSSDADRYFAFRGKVAETIVALRKIVGDR